MRGFIIFVLLVGLGILFLHQKHSETPAAPTKTVAAQSPQTKPTATPLTPAPRGQASEYNYMKRALDRAHDVTEQSRARTQADQNP
jgi:small neutral amino acid transporter SnatA (MarC family)